MDLKLNESFSKLTVNDIYDGQSSVIASSEKLYDYQKDGIDWLISNFDKKNGVILADDMGLGKTIQVAGFLSKMFKSKKIVHCLVICPKSLIFNWLKELKKWTEIPCLIFEGTLNKRKNIIFQVLNFGGILMCTYDLIRINIYLFNEDTNDQIWDCIVIDEAHKIATVSKTSTKVRQLKSKFKIALTGTPIQNNITELWNILDFLHNDDFEYTRERFQSEFDTPIKKSVLKDEKYQDHLLGLTRSQQLKTILTPIMLRRTKSQLSNNHEKLNISKKDYIISLKLTQRQHEIYQTFIKSREIINALSEIDKKGSKMNILKQVTLLRMIPSSPLLTCNWESMKTILNENEITDSDTETILNTSIKLSFLSKFIPNLINQKHKIIIFSQSFVMLDLISKVIVEAQKLKSAFIHGSIKLFERIRIIEEFQQDDDLCLLLITIKIGSVGLNLTAADTIIMIEPSWNPSTDFQAVDRVCRIGQTKPVTIYRLCCSGTVEEKIYKRQLFKYEVFNQVVFTSENSTTSLEEENSENCKSEDFFSDPMRLFSEIELRELFTMGDTNRCSLSDGLMEKYSSIEVNYEQENIKIAIESGALNIIDFGLICNLVSKNEPPSNLSSSCFNQTNHTRLHLSRNNSDEDILRIRKNSLIPVIEIDSSSDCSLQKVDKQRENINDNVEKGNSLSITSSNNSIFFDSNDENIDNLNKIKQSDTMIISKDLKTEHNTSLPLPPDMWINSPNQTIDSSLSSHSTLVPIITQMNSHHCKKHGEFFESNRIKSKKCQCELNVTEKADYNNKKEQLNSLIDKISINDLSNPEIWKNNHTLKKNIIDILDMILDILIIADNDLSLRYLALYF